MSELGQWVARYRDGRRITKYHYVESEIENREITRCGRQLHQRAGTEIRVRVAEGSPQSPLVEACLVCA